MQKLWCWHKNRSRMCDGTVMRRTSETKVLVVSKVIIHPVSLKLADQVLLRGCLLFTAS